MNKFLVLILLLVSGSMLTAQTWDAGGDGTRWDDPLNWDNDMIPAAGDIVTFNIGGTVILTTGSPVTAFPSRVLVTTGTNLDINLDLTIGDGTTTEHALKGQANVTITIKSGNTLTINVATNKEGIQNNASGNAVVTIEPGATVDILQARDGVQITAGNSLFVNGTLNITGADKDGITSAGTLVNSGSITVTEAGEDGIDINAGTFTNDGIVNATRNAGGDGGEYALDVNGTGTTTNNGIMTINGGTNTVSNAIALAVGAGGTFVNGSTGGAAELVLADGNDARGFLIDGAFTNGKGSTVDLTDRRGRVVEGTLVNDGLMLSTFSSSGIFKPGTAGGSATNNAFFYFGGQAFVNSGTDVGINLADPADLAIDLAGGCILDLANVDCVWSYESPEGGDTFLTGTDGTIDLEAANIVFDTDPSTVLLADYPTYGDIEVEISNICAAALPIELVKFSAEMNHRTEVELTWQTATEINGSYFEIERSDDASSWKAIGQVKAIGTTSRQQFYDYVDLDPTTGSNYYRLRMVDLDGYFEYSDIKQVMVVKDSYQVAVYPTVVSRGDNLTIDLSEIEGNTVQVDAYDLTGNMIRLGAYESGRTVLTDISSLSAGMHLITVSGVGYSETFRVVVTN